MFFNDLIVFFSVFGVEMRLQTIHVSSLVSSEAAGCGEGGGPGGGHSTLQDPPGSLLHPSERGDLPGPRRNTGHPAADGGEPVESEKHKRVA